MRRKRIGGKGGLSSIVGALGAASALGAECSGGCGKPHGDLQFCTHIKYPACQVEDTWEVDASLLLDTFMLTEIN
jgi:hypothetical protein